MRKRRRWWGELASQQWGLVTTAQATACGVDLQSLRRLVARGVLTRVRHGVYATTGTSPSAALEVKAHWLALRPELMAAERTGDPYLAAEAVVSHTTAAEMWGSVICGRTGHISRCGRDAAAGRRTSGSTAQIWGTMTGCSTRFRACR